MTCGNTEKKDLTMLVSVIVPVYKTEKYLKKCINSVLSQTYSNLEILLIDDGSPDNCGKICDDYAERDKRIRVIHNDNHGVSYSRNCGIKSATGKYLLFMDSDDYINSDYVEELVKSIQGYDIAISDILAFYMEKKSYDAWELFNVHGEITHQIRQDFQKLFCVFYPVWGKLYRAESLRQKTIFFDENISCAEDVLFNFQYLKYIATYNVSHAAKYIYVIRQEDSLSKEVTWRDDLTKVNKIVSAIKDFLYHENIKEKDTLLWLSCMTYINQINGGYKKYKKRISFIRSLLGKKYKTKGTKHKLLSICIRTKIYWPIYLYYKIKNQWLIIANTKGRPDSR